MGDWLKSENMTVRKMIDLPPVWLMGFICTVWAHAWIFPSTAVIPPFLSVLGAVLFWAGLALIGWALWAFRAHQTTVVPHQTPDRIITSGPFRFSRNPVYLGDLMVLAGVIVGQGAYVLIWLVPLLGMILARRFIAPEEARMKQSFGVEYATYMRKTRRWL